ncbi:MAG: hypothetical protein K2K19_07615 [Acetatifactor sp.]|nr:hypothetical protein [Acetatifactor sp.]
MKNKLKKRMISAVLCSVLLLGSVMLVQADTPICGGNHIYSNVGQVGVKKGENITTHWHNGQYCTITPYYKLYLQRCSCGAEKTVVGDLDHVAHSVD